MAAVASSQTKQETMYYEELDALTVKTNILSPLENEQKAVSKTKGKSHGKKKAKRKRDKAKNNANVNKQTAIPSPIGRGGATITYCRDTNKVYLLGGANRKGECFGMSTIDVFDLPTKSWSQVQAKGEVPSPRSGHTVVANGTFLYLFGGMARTQDHCLNDLYVLQVSNEASYVWSKILGKPQLGANGINTRSPAPCPRNGHTATFVEGQVISNEVNTINSTGASVPLALVYIFGGGSPTTGPLNDMHILDVTDPDDVHWRLLSTPFVDIPPAETNAAPPLPREMHSAVFFPAPCGSSASRVPEDTETRNAQEEGSENMNSANEENAVRDEISVNNDSDRNLKSHGERQIDKCPRPGKIYFYGGRGVDSICSDVLVFDVQTFQWKSEEYGMKTLIPRCGHVSAKLGDTHLAIMGGFDGQKVCNDLLFLNLKKNQWTEAALKPFAIPARFAHSSSFNLEAKIMYVYGGSNAEKECDDLIEMDLNVVIKDDDKDGAVTVVDQKDDV